MHWQSIRQNQNEKNSARHALRYQCARILSFQSAPGNIRRSLFLLQPERNWRSPVSGIHYTGLPYKQLQENILAYTNIDDRSHLTVYRTFDAAVIAYQFAVISLLNFLIYPASLNIDCN